MSLTRELENGNEIILLYAKNFKWKTKMHEEISDGQPVVGRVYRALHDSTNNVFYVKIDAPIGKEEGENKTKIQGLRITELKNTTPEWECEFEQLDDDNIIDYDIDPMDYRRINDWVESDHTDFIDELRTAVGLNVIASREDDLVSPEDANGLIEEDLDAVVDDDIKKLMSKALSELSKNSHTDLSREVVNLVVKDPMLGTALARLLPEVIDIIDLESNNHSMIPLSREVAIDKDYGLGANVYAMIHSLEEYVGLNGKDMSLLATVFIHLLYEVTRNQYRNNEQE